MITAILSVIISSLLIFGLSKFVNKLEIKTYSSVVYSVVLSNVLYWVLALVTFPIFWPLLLMLKFVVNVIFGTIIWWMVDKINGENFNIKGGFISYFMFSLAVYVIRLITEYIIQIF